MWGNHQLNGEFFPAIFDGQYLGHLHSASWGPSQILGRASRWSGHFRRFQRRKPHFVLNIVVIIPSFLKWTIWGSILHFQTHREKHTVGDISIDIPFYHHQTLGFSLFLKVESKSQRCRRDQVARPVRAPSFWSSSFTKRSCVLVPVALERSTKFGSFHMNKMAVDWCGFTLYKSSADMFFFHSKLLVY